MGTKLRNRGAWLLVVAVGLGLAARAAGQGREPARPEVRGMVKSVAAGSITVTIGEGREPAAEKSFALAKDAEVAIGLASGRSGYFKEGKLADVSAGTRVSLTLSPDQKTVVSLLAEGPMVRGQIKAVDATKNTLTISQSAGREAAAEEKMYNVATDAEIAADDGRGRRFSIKEVRLGELTQGAIVTAWLSLDRSTVQAMMAEGPSLFGTIKAIDAGKKTITVVVRQPRGDDAAEEKTMVLASDAVVLLDDGRGRRLSVKECKLGDVPVGTAAVVRLSVDQTLATQLRAEGPMLFGMLKAVDPGKGSLTIAIPRGRGDAPDEKTLPVAKDARISIEGKESRLGDLKATDDGPFIQLRLSLDQKTIQSVVARQPQSR